MTEVLKGVVILSGRKELIGQIRSIARQLEVPDEGMVDVASASACLKAVGDRDDVLVVLDWEAGRKEVLSVLQQEAKVENRERRFSLLMAEEMSSSIIECGTEFFVTKVHTGQLNGTTLRFLFQELVDEIQESYTARDDLLEVRALRDSGQWASATMKLQVMKKDYPDNPRVLVEYAENLMQSEDWEKAYAELLPLQKNDPPYPRALHMLGRCYMKLDRHSEAITVLERAKILNPFNVERLVELGNAFLKVDRVEDAKENFADALRLQPDEIGASQGKAHCMLMDGEINEGLQLLRQVSNNRELASIFNTAAIMTIRRGEFPQGLKLYGAAIKALTGDDRNLARIYYNKGIGYYRQRQDIEAQKCFVTAVELDPEHVNARYNAEKLQARNARLKTAVPAAAGFESAAEPGPSYGVGGFGELSDVLDDEFDDAFAEDDESI